MTTLTLEQVAEKMADIDFAMLSTRALNGNIAVRPMSNNRDVRFDGDSYYFTSEETHMVKEIKADAKVGLSFTGATGAGGKPQLFVAVEGNAELIREKPAMKEHWNEDIAKWFSDGFATPGIVLIKVSAERVHYWLGEEDGEIVL
ncbi:MULTISPECIES: pyridoxamine 5'-phosphate oxidase family protein [unclassified Caballeronia]|uniref:pyridoxamine 5'-phosphate oxidase family protein n=1 Tax=unclassified Caballeronia TaxID=2646786 RepID=UPI00285ED2B9|nr:MULTISPECIES: pyridoxamine 5'-phosphate oxidase family protein [unclassified Caballeronia]MDR5816021.1 pyridoxamine 5'-phosphate oxidase family protein [Caballeronia sp. LZ033]MDR5821776.1 pyridoxamine 5'-phosphate oxidase family protein [Caballeronia sp. LZ043]MDR5880736.1 pyridoxamine 5'-phosphate oxidase family protein [Caballeronia sp. LZ032]